MPAAAEACAGAELVLVVDGVDQFPKRDFTADSAAGCVVVMELVEAVPVGVLVKPVKTDGATVVLLVDAANNEDVLVEETVDDGLMVVRDGGCTKPPTAAVVVLPKMGLKFWTAGLLSRGGTAEEDVVVTEKMGLNPEASRGLVLLSDSELLAGAVVAVIGLDAEKAVGVLVWLVRPNRPAADAVLLGGLETWPST